VLRRASLARFVIVGPPPALWVGERCVLRSRAGYAPCSPPICASSVTSCASSDALSSRRAWGLASPCLYASVTRARAVLIGLGSGGAPIGFVERHGPAAPDEFCLHSIYEAGAISIAPHNSTGCARSKVACSPAQLVFERPTLAHFQPCFCAVNIGGIRSLRPTARGAPPPSSVRSVLGACAGLGSRIPLAACLPPQVFVGRSPLATISFNQAARGEFTISTHTGLPL